MAKLAATRPAAGAPHIGAWPLAHAWPAARAAAVPATILLLALVLRVYRLELQAWTPDTYEQLFATQRLVSGHFPVSGFYPPGVAITLAPAFIVLPQTLATQQAVIIASSLVLVAICYVAARHATRDRFAPALFAIGVAAMPQFVHFSRDGFFDLINTAWIAGAIFIVPWLRNRSTPVFVAYGVALAITLSVRASNPAMLPAIVIYWTATSGASLTPRAIWRTTFRRGPITAAIAMIAASIVVAWIGGSFGRTASNNPLNFDTAVANIRYYALTEFGGRFAAPMLIPLAALGATHLWRHNRALFYTSIPMLTIFPLSIVPLPFANYRYVLPSIMFALLLAAHAPAAVIEMTQKQPATVRNTWRAIIVVPLLLVGVYMTAFDTALIVHWPDNAALSDEAAYRQLRPIVKTLPEGSVIVSGGARGVRDSNKSLEYVDLIDYSRATDNGPQRVDEIMARIQQSLDAGRPTYYLYTSVEGINISFATTATGYQPYFDAASQRFHLTEVATTTVKYFTLYKIEPNN